VKDAAQFGLPPPDPTSAQTARILGTSRRTLYVLIASGHLESYLLGGRRRVRAPSGR
jgi:excisionase family DNA binding protein